MVLPAAIAASAPYCQDGTRAGRQQMPQSFSRPTGTEYILHLVTGKLPLKEGLMDTTKREVPQRERRFWTTLLVFEFLLILATRAAYARCNALRSLSD